MATAVATGITNTLAGFVPLNQLTEPSGDGAPDNNRQKNCVAASIAMGLTYLLGRPFYGDEVKDAAYKNPNYTGMQEPAHYVAYCASLGVQLAMFSAAPSALVTHTHAELLAGHPVLVAMPSQWGIPVSQQKYGYTTHVGCAAGWGPGWLRVANPWGGFWQDGNDAYWAARLCYGQVWSMSRKAGTGMWKRDGNGAIDSKQHTVGPGLASALIAANAPDATRSETPFNALGDVYVPLEDGQVYTWTHVDKQARTDRGGFVIEALNSQIGQLQAELAVARAGDAPPDVIAKAGRWDSLMALLANK